MKRHWFYGEKINLNDIEVVKVDGKRKKAHKKGWFPSRCVVLHDDEKAKYEVNQIEETDENNKKNTNDVDYEKKQQ